MDVCELAMKPFKDENAWYYLIISILYVVSTFPFIWVSYMCIKTGEYWPVALFGLIVIIMLLCAYRSFCKARDKFLDRRNK
jgi:hypothetical protein